MLYSEAIFSGILFGLFVALSVGPTLFAVMRYSMHHTYKAGLIFVMGVSISDIMYVMLANIATEWLKFLETHQFYIGIGGSVLFIIIGLTSFLKKYKPKRPNNQGMALVSNTTYIKIFLSGFAMNTFNPAVVILWLGASIKVAPYSLSEKIIFFGLCLGIVLVIDFCKVFLAEKIRGWLTLRKIMYLNKIAAIFILLFGILLLYKTLMGGHNGSLIAVQ